MSLDWNTGIIILVFVLGFLGVIVKIKDYINNFGLYLSNLYKETDEFLKTLSKALDDNSVSDDEIKTIIREAVDIRVAAAAIKDLLKKKK